MTEPTFAGAQRPSPQRVTSLVVTKTSIVCGTDFSLQAAQAVAVAAALATRLDEPLVLVHAVDKESRTTLPSNVRNSLCLYERTQLNDELERLRAAKVEVIEEFRPGKPDTVLVETAIAQHARLLIVSSHGGKPPGRGVLGSVAERTAEASPVPTLVVRTAAPLIGWALGKRRLRVFVGADFSAQSDVVLRWVASLRQVGPCDVVVTYLMPTLPAIALFDMSLTPLVAKIMERTEHLQARGLRQRVRAVLGANRVRVRIEKGWDRSDAHLIEVAREERADLIVVGTQQRHRLGRIDHLSVSRGVLHYAPMSVACVPMSGAAEQPGS